MPLNIQHKIRRKRNVTLLVILLAIVAIFFAMAVIKIG
jgi:hypothetical protein